MHSEALRYGYRPLRQATDEIRLFELLPAPSFEAKLEGTLREVSLKSKHQYEALSYVWGPPIFSHEVEIEGTRLSITLNLDNAMRYLRRSDSSRMLWVDAICIDQANLEERSQQVAMMKNIFESCDRCLAWLGPFVRRHDEGPPTTDDEGLKLAATGFEVFRSMYEGDEQKLQTMNSRMKKRKGGGKGRFRDDSESPPDEEQPRLLNQVPDYLVGSNDQWALEYVFERNDLWSRMWIVQELSCAPRVQLVAGHQTLELEDVLNFLKDEANTDAFHGTFSHGSIGEISKCFPHPKAVQQQRSLNQKAFSEGNSSSSLIDTLARFRHAKASDPRDMIYGLLGLVTDKHNVRVDYRKTVAQVFTETTKAIIDAMGNLDIICQNPWAYPRSLPPPEGLSSWVVDFTNRESVRGENEELLFAQRGIFKAGKPKFPVPCEIIDGRGLPVRGSIIGRLGKRPAVPDHKFWYSPHKSLQVNAMRAYLGEDIFGPDAPTYAATGEPQAQAFWRTVAMDCKAYPITRLGAEEISDTNSSFEAICRAEEIEKSWDDPLTKVFYDLHIYGMLGRQENRWSFAMTESGLFAMVRRNVMEGDVFAVLDGGKVPMVLRPVKDATLTGDCFKVVSPAYVHGFMDGEAQIGVSKGEIPESSIILV